MTHRDLLVVGNYAHDDIITEKGERIAALGGATAYMCNVLTALEADYDVVTKVGRDFKYMSQIIRAPIIDPKAPTTHFFDDFSSGRREGWVTSLCSPVLPEDLNGFVAHVAIANGCAGEVPPATVARMREIADIVVCDLQSLIRVVRPDGQIEHVKLSESGHPVESIDFLKGNEEEAAFVDFKGPGKRPALIITHGADGCEVIQDGVRTHVPSHPVEELDATGAGDSFIAGLGYGLSRGMDVLDAARLANFCGSLAVQAPGIPALLASQFKEFTREPARPVRRRRSAASVFDAS